MFFIFIYDFMYVYIFFTVSLEDEVVNKFENIERELGKSNGRWYTEGFWLCREMAYYVLK